MGIRGSNSVSSDASLLEAIRETVGARELLSDAKAVARKSLVRTTMENGSPPYPLLGRLWQAERVRDYLTEGDDASVSLAHRLWLLRRGFEAETESLYDFDRYPPSAYISDHEYRVLLYYLNEPWTEAIDNKLFFHWLFAPFDEHRMAVFGLVEDGYVHAIDRGSSRPAGDAVLDHLREEGRLVLKHATGAWGAEVSQCELRDGTPHIDGEPYDEATFKRRVAGLDGYLICEYVEQAEYSDQLYPGVANTVRVMTMWDDDAGEAFVPMAVQRIGTAKSAPLDNAHRGALVANVHLETGELSSAIASQHPEYADDYAATHPETGAQIEGVRIPGWQTIRDRVLEFAERYPFLPYVGWDVLVTDPGEFTILEANNHADIYLPQLHRPLLADARTRQFFVSQGVISEARAKAVAETLSQSGGEGRRKVAEKREGGEIGDVQEVQ
jgi:hypothetical protein